MAKSIWKFSQINQNQIYRYSREFKLLQEKQGFQKYGLIKGGFIINNINYMHKYYFSLGNSFYEKSFFPYNTKLNGYAFLKFKKPFNFKSKKKKK